MPLKVSTVGHPPTHRALNLMRMGLAALDSHPTLILSLDNALLLDIGRKNTNINAEVIRQLANHRPTKLFLSRQHFGY